MNIQPDLTDEDLERLSTTSAVAVDCEMGGLNPHRDLLYLVQLCDENDKIYIIRTDDWDRAVNLKRLFTLASLTKVFHFAIMDCAFILCHCHISVESAYCTKIASKLARTYTSTHSLTNLLEDMLGVKIEKKLQTSFWGNEEISQAQLEYAANDVRYLLGIRQKLETMLQLKGTLPSGTSYMELNAHCQAIIPDLVHLWLNGWDFGKEDINSIFGR